MNGHLFVVHGRIEDLRRDVAVIPVDSEFRIEAHWNPLLDKNPRPQQRWQSKGWTSVDYLKPSGNPRGPVYAVSIGDGFDNYEQVVERLEQCLSSLGEQRATLRCRRGEGTLPLVAVPVIGIGAAGFGDDRGAVLEALVAALHRASQNHGLDIALVTPEPSVYSAAQYARRKQPTDLPPALESEALRLGGLARAGKLALFTGAGVSIPAGLPSWHELVRRLAKRFGVSDLGSPKAPLTAVDQAQLIEIAAKDSFQGEIARQFKSRHRPSLVHVLLAGLDSREVVTTNYDLLYEQAVRATGRRTATVMPWQSALESDRWILKLHGDADHPAEIVLTRGQMVRYDAANRPSASVLQSLLLTRHLLFVGASLSDDNVLRLMYEVDEYKKFNHSGQSTRFGTVLDASGDSARRRLWSSQLTWLDLEEAGSGSGLGGPRMVELFLDRLGHHAARNSSWLLDRRFSGLMGAERDQHIADQLRGMYSQINTRPGSKWNGLVERLKELGIDGSSD